MSVLFNHFVQQLSFIITSDNFISWSKIDNLLKNIQQIIEEVASYYSKYLNVLLIQGIQAAIYPCFVVYSAILLATK